MTITIHFNSREEEIAKNKRGVVTNYIGAESMNKEMDKCRNEYNKLRTEIMYIVEERTRRIEEKIDKRLKEHKRQMERIIELLSGKVKGKAPGRDLDTRTDREEEYTIENSDEENDAYH